MSTAATLLGYVWIFISGVDVPLLGISFGTLFLSIIVINLSIAILKLVLGLGAGGFRNFGQKHKQDLENSDFDNYKRKHR